MPTDATTRDDPDQFARLAGQIRADVVKRVQNEQTEPSQASIDGMLLLVERVEVKCGITQSAYLSMLIKVLFGTASLALSPEEMDELLLDVLAIEQHAHA